MKFNPDKHYRWSIRLKEYDYSSRGDRPIAPAWTNAIPSSLIVPALIMSPKSLSSLMAGFQSPVTSKINQLRGTPKQDVWQRNYFDRIIRNDKELNRIRKYIIENPMKWDLDKENPNN